MNIKINTSSLIIIFSVGIGLFFMTYFLFIVKIIKTKKFKFKLQIFNKHNSLNKKTKNIKRKIERIIIKTMKLAIQEKYIVLAIILLSLGMSKSMKVLHINLVLGLVIGLILIWIIERIKKDMLKTQKLKEVVILFEGIEMYSKAGYSLVQSIRASKLLTNTITSSIDKCLSYWSMGPQKALEIFKNELNLEEIDSLILLMMHLESAGSKNLQGILQREAHNIERLQKMKVELKIAHRPLLLLVYKVLPITSFLGIVIGTLLYRMFYTFQGLGILK